MDQNNRNDRNRGGKNRGGRGMWSIVLWALLLTIGVNYISVMLEQARTAETSCEIAHSELVTLVDEGKINLKRLISKEYSIEDVSSAYQYIEDNRATAQKLILNI